MLAGSARVGQRGLEATLTLEPAAVHSMISLQVPDDRLHGLPPPGLGALLGRQWVALATVNELHRSDVGINTALAQVNHRGGERHAVVLS